MNWEKTGNCDCPGCLWKWQGSERNNIICGKIKSFLGLYMPVLKTKERKLTMVMVPLMTIILPDSEDAHYCYEHKIIVYKK